MADAVDGQLIELGRYKSLESAASARAVADARYFGEYARKP